MNYDVLLSTQSWTPSLLCDLGPHIWIGMTSHFNINEIDWCSVFFKRCASVWDILDICISKYRKTRIVRELDQVLPYSNDFKLLGRFEIHRVKQYLQVTQHLVLKTNVVLFAIKDLWTPQVTVKLKHNVYFGPVTVFLYLTLFTVTLDYYHQLHVLCKNAILWRYPFSLLFKIRFSRVYKGAINLIY